MAAYCANGCPSRWAILGSRRERPGSLEQFDFCGTEEAPESYSVEMEDSYRH
jgi:hypothetical protein